MQPTNSKDAFNLCSRIYPMRTSGVEETTLTSASARLVAAEEGLIGKSQEGHAMLGGSHDLQPPKVSQSPGHQETRTPYPAPVSYDGANPFAPCPPQLLEQSPEQLPGPGMQPFYPQQPDIGHGDNRMQYSVHGHAGWYTCLSVNPKRARMGSLLVLDCTLYILEYMWAIHRAMYCAYLCYDTSVKIQFA